MKALHLAVLLVLACAVASPAQTISLTSTADAFVSSANPNSNYGGAGALAVSAAGLPKGEFESLLQFNFATAKATFDTLYGSGAWTIQSMTLTLTATTPGNPLFNGNGTGPGGTNVNTAGQFSLQWLQNDGWIEGTGNPVAPSASGLNFNGVPALLSGADEALGTFSFNGATSGSAAHHLALTPSFLADATAGNLVSFYALPADANVAMLVNSRSVSTATSRPALVVTAVPEPATAALALTGLWWFGRRRRTARSGGVAGGVCGL